MYLKAALYLLLAAKDTEWVFKSDGQCEGGKGAERPQGCFAWEWCQAREVAKQVTEQGTAGRAGKGWHFNLYGSATQKAIRQGFKNRR